MSLSDLLNIICPQIAEFPILSAEDSKLLRRGFNPVRRELQSSTERIRILCLENPPRICAVSLSLTGNWESDHVGQASGLTRINIEEGGGSETHPTMALRDAERQSNLLFNGVCS